jgi:hypothetical protein
MLSLGSSFNYYFCAEPVTLRYSDESTLQVLDVPVDTKEGDEVPMHYYE